MTEPPEPARMLRGAERLGRLVENVLLAGLLVAMIVLAATEVLMRNVLQSGLTWGDEALRLLVLWSAMIGAVAASRDNAHLRIDVLSRLLPHRWRHLSMGLVDLFAAAVSAVLCWYSWQFMRESREFGDQVLGDLPAWTVQAVMPVAFALIAYRYLVSLIRQLLAAAGEAPSP